MAEYRLAVFQSPPTIQTRQIVHYRLATEQVLATSFFISRATCLWDAVGHFLGRKSIPQEACPVRLCGGYPMAGGRSALIISNNYKNTKC